MIDSDILNHQWASMEDANVARQLIDEIKRLRESTPKLGTAANDDVLQISEGKGWTLAQETIREAGEREGQMRIIRMEIELKYDEGIMHSDDQDAVDWFMNEVMGGELVLHSNELGDSVGIVKVLKHLPE